MSSLTATSCRYPIIIIAGQRLWIAKTKEVEALLDKQGFVAGMVHKPATERDNYSIAYDELIAPLVKAVQEQQDIIQSLKKENIELKKRIEKVEAAQIIPPCEGSDYSCLEPGKMMSIKFKTYNL